MSDTPKSVMLTDNEPISKERNPEMTLEEAKAEFLVRGHAVSTSRPINSPPIY